MNKKKSICIIGQGKLGSVLTRSLRVAGYSVIAIRRGEDRKIRQIKMADAVIITTQDQEIQKTARDLARRDCIRKGQVVLHCSGALTSSILDVVRKKGAHAASLHPLQSFPNLRQGISALPGTYWFFEGDKAAQSFCKKIVRDLNGKFLIIKPQHKAAYHAAVCLACNYQTTLIVAAEEIGRKIGFQGKDFRAALAPILRATLANTLQMGAKALTGPVRRGDKATVTGHIRALQSLENRDLAALYGALAAYTKAHIVKGDNKP